MENKTIQGLHEEFVAVENSREKLESAILIASDVIEDLQDISGLDSTTKQALIKLRGIYSIMDQVNGELETYVDNADGLIFTGKKA
jgi:hypothetical protein